MGTTDEPGSVLTTAVGAVARPGVYEFALGTPFTTVIEAAGGPTEPLGRLLVGGYFGTWLDLATAEQLVLAHGDLQRAGATLGCGVVAALPALSCGDRRDRARRALPRVGERGPMRPVRARARRDRDRARGARRRSGPTRAPSRPSNAGWVTSPGAVRAICPDAVVGFVRSSLAVFADDYVLHERKGRARPSGTCRCCRCPIPATRDRSWR